MHINVLFKLNNGWLDFCLTFCSSANPKHLLFFKILESALFVYIYFEQHTHETIHTP